ncbi:MAG: histidinol-phosphate transaminase [Burkholderiales bacterium]|nr:histidinol-phosphate transaminase [Burkholderiales bacterium]
MKDTSLSAPSWITSLAKYKASKPIEEVAAELGFKPEEIVMLGVNENPLGMSEKVRDKIAKAALSLNRYPDADACYLQKALATKYKVPQDWVVVTSGSSELLGLAAQSMLSEGKNAIFPQYSFSLYPMVTQLCGATAKEVPATEDFNADLDAMLDAIDENTRLIFLTNPNNPTGTFLSEKQIVDFLEKVPPEVMVLFDEAYAEFLEDDLRPDTVEIVKRFPNVLTARTFSKAYGLAGCRVGYGISRPEVLDIINRVRHPFNLNDLSQLAAMTALEDQEFLQKTLDNNQKQRSLLAERFSQWGLPYMGLHANFVTVKVGDGKDVAERLKKKGIMVRDLNSYSLPDWIRVTVGTEEQNKKFLSELKNILEERGALN